MNKSTVLDLGISGNKHLGINCLREEFRIIKTRNLTDSIINKCTTCKRYKEPPMIIVKLAHSFYNMLR